MSDLEKSEVYDLNYICHFWKMGHSRYEVFAALYVTARMDTVAHNDLETLYEVAKIMLDY